eukprot:jgi/Tetstr1/448197/TSEL_035487.t1
MYEVSSRGNTRPCNKYGTQSSSNLPGIMVHWCLHCKNCVMFKVMDSAEGPGSAFEHFHCFYPKMPDAISYDNGCNLHRYALNREMWLWKFVQILIDEFHAKNHVDCSCNYNSAEHKTKAGNFSLCEQKFAPLAASANAFSHMDQVSFLLLMRFKLACMNLYNHGSDGDTGASDGNSDNDRRGLGLGRGDASSAAAAGAGGVADMDTSDGNDGGNGGNGGNDDDLPVMKVRLPHVFARPLKFRESTSAIHYDGTCVHCPLGPGERHPSQCLRDTQG